MIRRPRLYGMTISHPARAARLMLEHKGIDHDEVYITPGQQALRMRVAGFRGGTVPALSIDGRRVVGTLAISRALEEIEPEPPLFPADPAHRRAVEEAEIWGERVLQPIPRRLLRWTIRNDREARLAFLTMLGTRWPALTARCAKPVVAFYARREDAASLDRIERDWEELPGHLEHVEALIAAGTIGTEKPNAADFQIATTLRVMLAVQDFAPLVEGTPCEPLARRIWPDYPYEFPPLRAAVTRARAGAG